MGLDMYLTGRKSPQRDYANPETDRTEDGKIVETIEVKLGYWRKHPNLHGYIVETFAEGSDECQDIDLSVEQMEQIIKAIQDGALPHTEGFFFGSSSDDLETRAEDVNVFMEAIEWVKGAPPRPQKDGVMGEYRYAVYRASW
jgi:hypothetical protein